MAYADSPSLIGLTSPCVRVYPPEAVNAEKFEARVRLCVINSRVSYFSDLWALAQERAFSGAILAAAIRATFMRRAIPLPASTPLALTDPFAAGTAKLRLWQTVEGRTKLQPSALPLTDHGPTPRFPDAAYPLARC